MKHKRLWRIIRQILGASTFILITLLFLDFSGVLHKYLSFLAKMQFIAAFMTASVTSVVILIAILAVTLVFGRVYCSVVCPMGIFQDGMARLGRIGRKNPCSYSKAKNILRYSILVVFIVVCSMAGFAGLASLIEPYSAYGRMAQNLFQPVYLWCNNLLALIAERANSYAFYEKEVWIRSIPTFVIAAVTFVAIGFLAIRNGRTYCNTICPVGSILGLFSRFSLLKMHIDEEKCVGCDLCTKNCKASCINGKEHLLDYSRCVMCGDCMALCPQEAIDYKHIKWTSEFAQKRAEDAKVTEQKPEKVDEGKRAFTLTSLMLLAGAATAQTKVKLDGGLAKIEDKMEPKRGTPIVPPGAHSLKDFTRRCTACQLCVSKCPNDVLRPSNELTTLMQPRMSFEKGACRVECTACSEVCPTGAISLITKEEKSAIKIGHAVWVQQNCVTVTDKVECGNCARHCPAGAIMMLPSDPKDESSAKRPVVNENKCIGCGMCEYVCPSRPYPAIFVVGEEEHEMI